ncbi:MAG: transposase [Syntrophomonas sp.]|nr:transposase [Syntrophomonas sp.]
MAYIKGEDRQQITLFPESIDEYISEDNQVRVIEAFVIRLDVAKLGFKYSQEDTIGRPSYNPRDMLKLYLYGYLNRIRSSRRLETEAGRNLELIWLMRKLKPDFKTIADFRKDNKKPLMQVFKQFSLLCKEWNLYSREVVAVDGSKFRASNSKRNNYNEKKLKRHLKYIDEKIEQYMNELEAGDQAEAGTHKPTAEEIKQRIKELKDREFNYEEKLEGLQNSEDKEISTTDPDARLMAVNNNGIEVCYNVQRGRTIFRHIDQELLDEVDQRTSENKKLYARRQMIVEHPFGTVKRSWGYGHFLTRGLESVRMETCLNFLAYNMKRVINILGVKEMIKRLQPA